MMADALSRNAVLALSKVKPTLLKRIASKQKGREAFKERSSRMLRMSNVQVSSQINMVYYVEWKDLRP